MSYTSQQIQTVTAMSIHTCRLSQPEGASHCFFSLKILRITVHVGLSLDIILHVFVGVLQLNSSSA